MPTAIEDKDAIREVLAEYCFALDNYRFADMAALFTEDGTWDTAFGKATGHKAIADLAASFTKDIAEPPRRVHYVTNVIIRLSGDSASVRSNWVVVQNSAAGPVLGSGGAYEDQMVRRAGLWLFWYRKIDRFLK
jgi:3-phenylpropionate/cinnamic acid dioxygenase small subunit